MPSASCTAVALSLITLMVSWPKPISTVLWSAERACRLSRLLVSCTSVRIFSYVVFHSTGYSYSCLYLPGHGRAFIARQRCGRWRCVRWFKPNALWHLGRWEPPDEAHQRDCYYFYAHLPDPDL